MRTPSRRSPASCRCRRIASSTAGTGSRPCRPTCTAPATTSTRENSHVLPALMRRIHEAKTDGAPRSSSGAPARREREFLYVDDLARAALFLLENYDSPADDQRRRRSRTCRSASWPNSSPRSSATTASCVQDASKPDGHPEEAARRDPHQRAGLDSVRPSSATGSRRPTSGIDSTSTPSASSTLHDAGHRVVAPAPSWSCRPSTRRRRWRRRAEVHATFPGSACLVVDDGSPDATTSPRTRGRRHRRDPAVQPRRRRGDAHRISLRPRQRIRCRRTGRRRWPARPGRGSRPDRHARRRGHRARRTVRRRPATMSVRGPRRWAMKLFAGGSARSPRRNSPTRHRVFVRRDPVPWNCSPDTIPPSTWATRSRASSSRVVPG